MMKRKTEEFAKTAQRGFTLVELLVVVAILGILGAIAVQEVTGHVATARVTAAEAGVRAIQEACTAYYLKHKKMPSSLDQLVEGDDPILDGGEGALYDPWDNRYEMEVKGGKAIIWSHGAKEDDESDDIRSNVRKVKGKIEG